MRGTKTMCMGSPNVTAQTPAAAPPPAEAPPQETDIGAGRKAEEEATFGDKSPGELTRVDRSITGGVRGGAGIKM